MGIVEFKGRPNIDLKAVYKVDEIGEKIRNETFVEAAGDVVKLQVYMNSPEFKAAAEKLEVQKRGCAHLAEDLYVSPCCRKLAKCMYLSDVLVAYLAWLISRVENVTSLHPSAEEATAKTLMGNVLKLRSMMLELQPPIMYAADRNEEFDDVTLANWAAMSIDPANVLGNVLDGVRSIRLSRAESFLVSTCIWTMRDSFAEMQACVGAAVEVAV